MKSRPLILCLLLAASSSFADPWAYHCSPAPIPSPTWVVTYSYAGGIHEAFAATGTLYIGRVDLAVTSAIPGHMDMHWIPLTRDRVNFFTTVEREKGLKMEWTFNSPDAPAWTNTEYIAAGVDTVGTNDLVSFTVHWAVPSDGPEDSGMIPPMSPEERRRFETDRMNRTGKGLIAPDGAFGVEVGTE